MSQSAWGIDQAQSPLSSIGACAHEPPLQQALGLSHSVHDSPSHRLRTPAAWIRGQDSKQITCVRYCRIISHTAAPLEAQLGVLIRYYTCTTAGVALPQSAFVKGLSHTGLTALKCPGGKVAGMAGMLTGVCECRLVCPDAVPVKVELRILVGECASVAAVVCLGVVLHIGAALKGPLVTARVVSGGITAMQHSEGYREGSQQAAASPASHGPAQRCRAVGGHHCVDVGRWRWILSCWDISFGGPGFQAVVIGHAGCFHLISSHLSDKVAS